MNRRQFLSLGIPIAVEAKFKPQTEVHKRIEKIINSYVLLDTTTFYKDKTQETKENRFLGIGIVVNDFVLTLDHLVSFYNRTEENPLGEKVDRISEETKLTGRTLEERLKNREKDIAIFKLPEGHRFSSYPFGLGNSDSIEYGQEVYVIGNPRLNGIIVREGIIGSRVFSKHPPLGTSGFYTSIIFIEGDSGTAVIDKKDFSLLGLAAETHGAVGYVRPINLYKGYIPSSNIFPEMEQKR